MSTLVKLSSWLLIASNVKFEMYGQDVKDPVTVNGCPTALRPIIFSNSQAWIQLSLSCGKMRSNFCCFLSLSRNVAVITLWFCSASLKGGEETVTKDSKWWLTVIVCGVFVCVCVVWVCLCLYVVEMLYVCCEFEIKLVCGTRGDMVKSLNFIKDFYKSNSL